MIKFSRPYWLTKELRFMFLVVPAGVGIVLASLYNSQHSLNVDSKKGRPLTQEEYDHVRQHKTMRNLKGGTGGGRYSESSRPTEEAVNRLPPIMQYWWHDLSRVHNDQQKTHTRILDSDAEAIIDRAAQEQN